MERQRAKHLWSFRSWVWQGRRDQGQQHRDNEHQTTVPLLQRSQRQVLWLLLPWRGRIYPREQAAGRMPMPRPTKSSDLLYQNARLPRSEMGSQFKMKKFQRVEGRVNSFNNRRK